MSSERFDCVVVGARCAGAPLATHLARAGMKVCLLDAHQLPSDQPFSTHAIQPTGGDLLHELGVGEKLREISPAIDFARLAVGDAHLDVRYHPDRPLYCPRRTTLDALLQQTAVAAGAELRDRTAVIGLIRDGDRVSGVRVKTVTGAADIRARWVVGADGRHSTIARLVEAEEYFSASAPRAGYWAYFPKWPGWGKGDAPYRMHIGIRGEEARFVFETADDLLLIGGLSTPPVFAHWTADPTAHLIRFLAQSPVTAPLVEGRQPVEKPVGLRKLTCFFKKPVGDGWALVGDAGLHKDPTPGYGITDALRDAKALASALVDGRPAALDAYHHERDVESIPLYFNAENMGSLELDNPFNRMVFRRLNADASLAPRILAALERRVSPFEMVPMRKVVSWMLRELVRGQFSLVPLFLKSGQRGAWVKAEVARRQTLLYEAKAQLFAPLTPAPSPAV